MPVSSEKSDVASKNTAVDEKPHVYRAEDVVNTLFSPWFQKRVDSAILLNEVKTSFGL